MAAKARRVSLWCQNPVDFSNAHPLDSRAALAQASTLIRDDQLAAALAVLSIDRDAAKETFARAAPKTRRAAYHLQDESADQSRSIDLLPGQSIRRLAEARQLAIDALIANPLSDEARWHLISLDFVNETAPDQTATLIEQSASLRPNTPTVLAPLAEMASTYPGIESSASIWRRLLQLKPRHLPRLWKWLDLTGQTDRLLNCLPDELPIYADAVDQLPGTSSQRERWLAAANELMSAQPTNFVNDRDLAEDAYARARLAEAMDDWKAVQDHYRSAVNNNPSQIDWRYRWVLAAERIGDKETALEQIGHCLLQQPHNTKFQNKAKQLGFGR